MEKCIVIQNRHLTTLSAQTDKLRELNLHPGPELCGLQDLECNAAARVWDTGQQCWWTKAETGRSVWHGLHQSNYQLCCLETSVRIFTQRGSILNIRCGNWTNSEEDVLGYRHILFLHMFLHTSNAVLDLKKSACLSVSSVWQTY